MTTTLLLADLVIDKLDRAPQARGAVAIRDNLILDVGPAEKVLNGFREGATVIECPACTILPGLIDPHVHLTFSGSRRPFAELEEEDDGELCARGVANARTALLAGITTLRDLGARNDTGFSIKRALSKQVIPGPRVYVSGPPITTPEGHLHFLGGAAEGVDGVRRMAEKLVQHGADVIKLNATGGNMTLKSDPYRAQYTIEEIKAAVEVANAAGLKITVHARGVEGIRAAVRAGVHSVEHSRMEVPPGAWGFDADLAKEMRDRGVTAAPTLASSYRGLQHRAEGIRAGSLPFDVRLQNARALREHGIRVTAGSDAGATLVRFDECAQLEMESLVMAGWTPLEAIEAGTRGSAFAMGLTKIGELAPGKLADILVVRGNPTTDITHCRQVELVFLDGKLVVERGQILNDRRPYPWPLTQIETRSDI
jgi:imidazolonepropionase-like amidohydrolase